MNRTLRVAFVVVLLFVGSAGLGVLYGDTAAESPLAATSLGTGRPQELLYRMVGTWSVGSRIWPSPDAQPVSLPPAVAVRRIVGESFLEEVMTPGAGTEGPTFTRIAYLNYNEVNHRYEWISMDTRAPQMMFEKGDDAAGRDARSITLHLDFFVLPQWGSMTNAAFRQRRVIEVGQDRQVTRQYWTPLSGGEGNEFLAVEYVYTRKR